MLNITIFLISISSLAWVCSNLGDDLPLSLVFVAFLSAISAGGSGLRICAAAAFLLLEYVPSCHRREPVRVAISLSAIAPLSNHHSCSLYHRRYDVPMTAASVPKSCWF